MKRIFTVWMICLLLMTLACAKQPEAEPAAPKVLAPGETELVLTLPLGARDETAKTVKDYTEGFSASDHSALRFSVTSADASVAEGVLADGTLYVLARGAGETKLTVTAETEAGDTASAVVSVTVRDARRMVVLILLGVLSVALLVLLGKPVKKDGPDAKPVEPDPDTPNDNPERS